MKIISPSKYQSATVNVAFDFLSQLELDETISSASVSAVVASGTDSDPSAILSGSADASGTTVNQLVTGGVSGVTYLLTASITTSAGQDLILQTYLAVISSNPFA